MECESKGCKKQGHYQKDTVPDKGYNIKMQLCDEHWEKIE